jgi:hypothetical protein
MTKEKLHMNICAVGRHLSKTCAWCVWLTFGYRILTPTLLGCCLSLLGPLWGRRADARKYHGLAIIFSFACCAMMNHYYRCCNVDVFEHAQSWSCRWAVITDMSDTRVSLLFHAGVQPCTSSPAMQNNNTAPQA